MLKELLDQKGASISVRQEVKDWIAQMDPATDKKLYEVLKNASQDEILMALNAQFQRMHPPTPTVVNKSATTNAATSSTSAPKKGFLKKLSKSKLTTTQLVIGLSVAFCLVIGLAALFGIKTVRYFFTPQATSQVVQNIAPTTSQATSQNAQTATITPTQSVKNPSIIAPLAPSPNESIGFNSAPFIGTEQWLQLVLLIALIITVMVDTNQTVSVLKKQAQLKVIKAIQLWVAPIAAALAVVCIIGSDMLFISIVDQNTRHIISSSIGIVFLGIGFMSSGYDLSYLGTTIAFIGIANAMFTTNLPFNITADQNVFNLAATWRAASNHEWLLATRSIWIYICLAAGIILVARNIFQMKEKAAMIGFVLAVVIAGSTYGIDKYFSSTLGLLIIAIAILINILVDPDAADEGTALGIISGFIMIIGFGTPLFVH